MFKLFQSKKNIQVVAPITGKLILVNDVPDDEVIFKLQSIHGSRVEESSKVIWYPYHGPQ
ncbi:hypothetical protein [Candidatus Enterococcus lowellii]|uniref:hypothetical protein n=1 Tax=Candidatus Enterococcus lowellii TaxID=2230877 RepID=UPI001A9E1C56|nr:hypothetical protein [Enterococcus sp. DIV2402]MBO0463817.1 hypothetical protein [Enterococcus sp. DIV2402]